MCLQLTVSNITILIKMLNHSHVAVVLVLCFAFPPPSLFTYPQAFTYHQAFTYPLASAGRFTDFSRY